MRSINLTGGPIFQPEEQPEIHEQEPEAKSSSWWERLVRKIKTSRTASIQIEEGSQNVRGVGLPDGNEDSVAVEAIETLVELERDIDPLSNDELRHLARLLREDSEGNQKLADTFSAYADMRANQARPVGGE